mgnify:FL=1
MLKLYSKKVLMLIEKLLTLLFPVRCAVCGKGTEGAKRNKLICSGCLKAFSASTEFHCPLCEAKSIGGEVCFSCLPLARGKFHLDRLFSPFSYKEPAVRKTIKALKYDFIEGLAGPLGKLMTGYLGKIGNEVDFKDFTVIPVPLHRIKFNRRGYNQSELVAIEISKSINLGVVNDLLLKTRPTKDQASLKEERKVQNVKGSFVCPKPESVAGRKILLIDDVYTTGATMNECARVLKQSGAAEVSGLAIARG